MAAKIINKFEEAWNKFHSDCQNGKFQPVYLFQGDETFFISKLADLAEESVIPASGKDFNQHILYGKDVQTEQVLSLAKRFPMMADRQLVMVKEAQHLTQLDNMIPYLEKPASGTVLILCFMGKKINMNTLAGRAFQKHFVFNAEPVSEGNIISWITEYTRTLQLQISDQDAWLLYERTGNNLSTIAGELEKLAANLQDRTNITPKDIADNVGITREYDIFEFTRALGSKNQQKISLILKNFVSDPGSHPFPMSLGMIFSYFQKVMLLHSIPGGSDLQRAQILKVPMFAIKDYQTAAKNYPIHKLKAVFQVIHEMDLKSKAIQIRKPGDAELYKELIVKIMR